MTISSNRLAKAKPVQPDSFVFSKLARLAPFLRRVEPERRNFLWIWFLTPNTCFVFFENWVQNEMCLAANWLAWTRWAKGQGWDRGQGQGRGWGKFHCRDQQQTDIQAPFWPFVIDVGVEALGTADTTDVLAHSVFSLFVLGVGWGAGGGDT